MNLQRCCGGSLLITALLLAGCGQAPPPTPIPVATDTPIATTMPATAPTTAAASPTPAPAAVATATMPWPTATLPAAAPSATPAPSATGIPATATAGALTKVTLALDWTPNTNHTGFYVAQQKGWYQAQGIDLQILPYSDAVSPDALVAAGKADFAISFVEQVVIDRVTGLPVKSVAALIQHNTSELVTLKDSGLDRPAKLEGKRYAGFGSPYEEPVIAAVIKHDGGKTGQIQNITTNTGGLQALEAKQADFVWIYKGWEAIQARHDKVALNEFLIKDYGVPDYYSPVLITGESFLQDKRDLGKRFLAATAQGFQFAIAHPDAAADLLIAANTPDTFPDKTLVHESAQYLATQYQAEAPAWGVQTLQAWSGYPRFMVQTGKLEDANHKPVTADLDYSAMFSNTLLPAP
ncbi:MAG TPA: ABC transporter substrate-binding protein [Chloroflexia bacterium]|nr:ABC transporter substrate-binding protein [Chloroflexia bacterium]